MKFRWAFHFVVLAGMACLSGAPIDFEEKIKPILEEKCYRCHDEEKVEGDLRLDSPEGILAGGEGGVIIVPGKPNESLMYVLTTYPKDDPDYMPQKGKGLTRAQQGLLKAWIEEGALFGAGFVHTPKNKVKSKFSDTDLDTSRKYMIMGDAVEIVAKLRNSGLLVDTVNHDASRFEVIYTYAERQSGTFDFDSLAPLKDSLKKLTLARSEVRSVDLEPLKRLTSIEYMDLSRTKIDDSAMEYVSEMENLIYLNLRNTGVTDSGIQKLAKLRQLEKVYVWGSLVTPAGAKQLEKRLEGVSVILGTPIIAPSRRRNNPQA